MSEPGVSAVFVFDTVEQLRRQVPPCALAVHTGPAGGLWYRDGGAPRAAEGDNGGTIALAADGSLWRRICDPSRLDARWFSPIP